jgi:hypothetical protein
MNSTTITIGLVVLALAVGGWILLRGGKEEEEEEAVTPSGPPAPRPPTPANTPASGVAANGMSPNGMSANGMSPNGMSPNGMSANAMNPNGVSPNGMASPGMYGAAYGAAAVPAVPSPMSSVPAAGSTYFSSATSPLTSEGHAYEVRARWQELQLRFVDDPQTAAGEAERLVDDALAGVTASLNARKDQLSTWRASGRDDTEQLRAAVHGYRDFLTHLVGP